MFFPVFCALSTLITSASASTKDLEKFRNYADAPTQVRHTYYNNHTMQTLDFVLKKQKEYLSLNHGTMNLWEVVDILDHFVDESDPDTTQAQSIHAFQTAEALRKDGRPRWMILTGFIHDLGKLLSYFGEPQWAVVGDTFPVGCQFEKSNIFYDYFIDNPDSEHPIYQKLHGIYKPHCGFNQLNMSFGHDEYLYHVMKPYLPKEALYIIRFHSFYPAHRQDGYTHFINEEDKELLPYLKLFCSYDLYSKSETPLNIKALLPYYKELVAEFLPENIQW